MASIDERETLMDEGFKPIAGYEDAYGISKGGVVVSYPRRIITARGGEYWTTLKTVRSHIVRNGYKVVYLRKNGKPKTHMLHRLIARAYISNPHHLPEINHKDEDKLNNAIENLEWCSRKYNMAYGTIMRRMSETKRNSSREVCRFTKSGEFIDSYRSPRDAKEAIGKSGKKGDAIYDALTNKRKCPSYSGFQWFYRDELLPVKVS